MLNSCDFQGRFAADPELRTTQTGKQVASFRMAVDRDMVDANGHRPTDWLTFTAWGKTAEFVSRYFRKGSAAVVHSRCQTRQYEDTTSTMSAATPAAESAKAQSTWTACLRTALWHLLRSRQRAWSSLTTTKT